MKREERDVCSTACWSGDRVNRVTNSCSSVFRALVSNGSARFIVANTREASSGGMAYRRQRDVHKLPAEEKIRCRSRLSAAEAVHPLFLYESPVRKEVVTRKDDPNRTSASPNRRRKRYLSSRGCSRTRGARSTGRAALHSCHAGNLQGWFGRRERRTRWQDLVRSSDIRRREFPSPASSL